MKGKRLLKALGQVDADYIEEACTVEAKGPDGSVRKYVNEDMKQTVTRHLIEEIPKFPLIGQEGEA